MKYLFLISGICFLVYTIRCLVKDPFYRGLVNTWRTIWGRQFLIDLNIGFIFWGLFYYMFTKSIPMALVGYLLTVFAGNIFPLFFIYFYFDDLLGFLT